ncbi:MAG: hypothetical protein NPINA01_16440 [Nitrospinaceae bacterium]|nr:MAG: hypothetical protein NPINA01_16440 [Nitrospinaceae bacterium]
MLYSTVLKIMSPVLTVLFLIALFANPVGAKPNPEKVKKIKKLLAISGIQDQLSYMKDGVLSSYGQMVASAYPKVPDAFWDDFNALVGEKDMDVLLDQVVPVYDKHMSGEAINKLIEMFETPFWKEWKEKMPTISREAGVAGQQWVQKITQSENFKQKIDQLIAKHELEKLNPPQKHPK